MDDNKNLNNEDKGYNLDEFDSDYIILGNDKEDKKEYSVAPDYGDDFVLANDEDNSGYAYNIDSEDEYAQEGTAAGKKPVKKKRTGRNVAIVFTVLAIICLIAAVIFALTQCTGGSKPQISTTTATTTAAATTAEQTSQTSAQEQTQADTTAQQQSETQQTSQEQPDNSGSQEISDNSEQVQQSSQVQSSQAQSSQAQSSQTQSGGNTSEIESSGSGGTVIEAPDEENDYPDAIQGEDDDLDNAL